MYEQSAKWNEFYKEMEPAKRRQMFSELMMQEPDDGANMYRKHLLDLRYQDPKNPEREVDLFLWQCVNLPYVYKTTRFFTGGAKKEVTQIFKGMGAEDASSYGEAGERAFYWEMRNTLKRYLSTCDNKGYRKKFFGLVSASDEERETQILKDIWEMSEGLAIKLDLEDKMKIFNQAVTDSYAVLDDQATKRYEEYAKERSAKLRK